MRAHSAKLLVMAAAAALLGLATLLRSLPPVDALDTIVVLRERDDTARRPAEVAALGVPLAPVQGLAPQRSAESEGERVGTALRTSAMLVQGRVVDAQGAGVFGCEIVAQTAWTGGWTGALEPTRDPVYSDASGSFAIQVPVGGAHLTASCAGLVTLREAQVGDGLGEARIVVARAQAFELRVVDQAGQALEGVRVTAREQGSPRWTARTDCTGTATFSALPLEALLELRAVAPGFVEQHAQLQVAERPSGSGLTLVLESAPGGIVLTGFVREPDGTPAAGARVQAGECATRTDRDGRFVLALSPALPDGLVAHGRNPQRGVSARFPDLADWVETIGNRPPPLFLDLDG